MSDTERSIDRVLRWSQERGWTDIELALALGIGSSAMITNWKKRGMPNVYAVRAATIFGKSTDEVLGNNAVRDAGIGAYTAGIGIPVVGTAQLGAEGYWTAMDPQIGTGGGSIRLPTKDPDAYSLRVVGDAMHPRIKSGEFVVIEPGHPYQPGDEVLVVTRDGRNMIKEFLYSRDGFIVLQSVNDGHARLSLPEADVEKVQYVAAIVKSALFRLSDDMV